MGFIINIKVTRGKDQKPLYFNVDVKNSKSIFDRKKQSGLNFLMPSKP